jgi:hypothetical protein
MKWLTTPPVDFTPTGSRVLDIVLTLAERGTVADCERVWDTGLDSPCAWPNSPGPGEDYEYCHGSFAINCPLPDGHRSVIYCIGSNC